MKKYFIWGFTAFQILFCTQLMAQETAAPAQMPAEKPVPDAKPDANHAVVQINQPYVSKSFGELTLPFMWEVEVDETAKRLIATETRTEQPARLTMDIIPTPKDANGEQIARDMITAVAETLGTTAQIQVTQEKLDCGKSKKCPKLTFVRTHLEGHENGIPRQCAIEIVPSSGQVAVLSLCAHAKRIYEPELSAIVHQVFSMMK